MHFLSKYCTGRIFRHIGKIFHPVAAVELGILFVKSRVEWL